ncbi:A24 family peptidase [Rhizobium sp. LjRoot258]|uniref:A24 family peptidase n=1 Tax=Rhizobium sp. LjRoot258 TaxID=3342299 RepID=UPI003ECF4CF4
MIAAAVFVIFPLCLAIAAFSDLFTMTIPNRASIILSIAFLGVATLAGMPLFVIGTHLAAAFSVLAVCFVLFALNIMGGGDAKLLASTSLWFGFDPALVELLVYVGVFGGIACFVILLIRTQAHVILAVGLPIPNSILLAKKIPYGIAIAAGGFIAFPSSPLFIVALESLK